MSQFLSILSSNSNLRYLELSGDVFPDPDGCASSFQVRLPHLTHIQLSGGLRDVLGLLNQLVPSDKMDSLNLDLSDCPVREMPQPLGSYLGCYLRNHGGSREGSTLGAGSVPGHLIFRVREWNKPTHDLDWLAWVHVHVTGPFGGKPSEGEQEKAYLDVLTHIPLARVISSEGPLPLLKSEDLSVGLSNLLQLCAVDPDLRTWFPAPDPRGTHPYEELLPSLKHLTLRKPWMIRGEWSPLTTFLSRSASAGNQLGSLTTVLCRHICPDVVRDVGRTVVRFDRPPFEGFSIRFVPFAFGSGTRGADYRVCPAVSSELIFRKTSSCRLFPFVVW